MSVQYDIRFGTADYEIDKDELREEISEKIRECEVFLVLTYPVAHDGGGCDGKYSTPRNSQNR